MLQRIDDGEQVVKGKAQTGAAGVAAAAWACGGQAGLKVEERGSSWVTLPISKRPARKNIRGLLDFHDVHCQPAGKNCRPPRMTNPEPAANRVMVARHPKRSSMPSAKRILLVDEEAVPRHSLAEQLAREAAYAVIEAGSAAEARAAKDMISPSSTLEGGKGEALAQRPARAALAGRCCC